MAEAVASEDLHHATDGTKRVQGSEEEVALLTIHNTTHTSSEMQKLGESNSTTTPPIEDPPTAIGNQEAAVGEAEAGGDLHHTPDGTIRLREAEEEGASSLHLPKLIQLE